MNRTRKTRAPSVSARLRRWKRKAARHGDLALPIIGVAALGIGIACFYWPGIDRLAPIIVGTGVLALWVWVHP